MSFRPLRSVGADFQSLDRRRSPFRALSPAADVPPEPEIPANEVPAESDAPSNAENTAAQAHEEGYESGYREGLARAREELDGSLGLAREVVHELETARAQLLTSSRNDLVDVLATSLEWLHRATLEQDQELVVRLVDSVLEDFKGGDDITVLVNPLDHETLSAELSLGRKAWATWDLTIQSDPTVERGGCAVLAPEGTVDATITDRLARLREELDLLRASDEPTIREPAEFDGEPR